MKPDFFAGVVTALSTVSTVAGRLPKGDAEGHLRRSIEEFAGAFSRHEALEPAVARMRGSIVMLHESRRLGRRRAYEDDKTLVGQLDRAVEDRLLPELRRMGFGV
jgi:hypothetical protein